MLARRTVSLLALGALALGDQACGGDLACAGAGDADEQGLLQFAGLSEIASAGHLLMRHGHRLVPPRSEWPTASGSCTATSAARTMLSAARQFIKVISWNGYSVNNLNNWKNAVNRSLCVDTTLYADVTGEWHPRVIATEYFQMLNPAYNGGMVKVINYTINENSLRCDTTKGVITLTSTITFRFRNSSTVSYETYNDQYFSLVYDTSRKCILAEYGSSPAALVKALSTPPPELICQGGLQLCGSRFPYSSLNECIAFMTAIPAQCGTARFAGNTTACRAVHLAACQIDPAVHCSHLSATTGACPDANCPADQYQQSSPDMAYFDSDNCYNRAGSFALCQQGFSTACCDAVRAYDQKGCFCDKMAMQDLPSSVQTLKRFAGGSCRISFQSCR